MGASVPQNFGDFARGMAFDKRGEGRKEGMEELAEIYRTILRVEHRHRDDAFWSSSRNWPSNYVLCHGIAKRTGRVYSALPGTWHLGNEDTL
ncbi:hypothetical protein AXG93_1713s1120 [Marchantia polymorpha subsp. ruderalis]|uniref:Uncharacterized protein n=1 Tax=Marchantia polymorpha subsp. ruderalis TaxID=1480154 RepID=A0A176VSK9_MARPO|nr:hypothetical protein AXG93_1713s1120 [Marchantia polymorpha subsp. ruderalis]